MNFVSSIAPKNRTAGPTRSQKMTQSFKDFWRRRRPFLSLVHSSQECLSNVTKTAKYLKLLLTSQSWVLTIWLLQLLIMLALTRGIDYVLPGRQLARQHQTVLTSLRRNRTRSCMISLSIYLMPGSSLGQYHLYSTQNQQQILLHRFLRIPLQRFPTTIPGDIQHNLARVWWAISRTTRMHQECNSCNLEK